MNNTEKSPLELLQDKLVYTKKSFFEVSDEEKKNAALEYAKGYMAYLDSSKTEREAVISAIELAKKAGYTEYKIGDKLTAGGKYYLNNRGKSLFVFKLGSEDVEKEGIKITAAHVDSPRLDLKPVPLYEASGMSFLKTHYYGGVRKYQWTAIPLALHGVVALTDGTVKDIVIGEDEGDPIFYINDLLPHLAADQNSKPLGSAISGESLNLLSGSSPAFDGTGKDEIKLNVLRILNEKYGIVETDFISAELTAVPVFKARDIGLDRWLIGSYGHDDRVCAYPALTSLLDSADTKHTVICVLADKEEVGSDGVSGMQCRMLADIIDEISEFANANANTVRMQSACLSADVCAAYDPNFPEVFELRNAAMLSCGVSLCKYTGSRGKGGSNDASAEFVGKVRACLEENNVNWQMAELGKIDVGGGGTVAKFVANHNIDTVDIGVPVISMHAPYEVVSKADVYSAYLAFAAFIK